MSSADQSVNFIWHLMDGQIEARYVRRRDDRYICYLSVMTGCSLGCKMCHLTQTGQTRARDLALHEVYMQAREVVGWVKRQVEAGDIPVARGVDFSFMARGDFFANQALMDQADDLVRGLERIARSAGLTSRVKISTIMPRALGDRQLSAIFRQARPDIYYSLYSLQPAFRRTWLPRAMDPMEALMELRSWQRETRKIIVLHGAFIAGENDDAESIQAMGEAVKIARLRVDFNLVRYNPFSELQGIEANVDRCVTHIVKAFPGCNIKVVDRVGPDVYASCGMFMPA